MRPHRDCGGDRDFESEMHQQHLQKRVVEKCQLEFAATSPTTLCRSGRWQSRCRCEDGAALEAQEPAVRRAARSVFAVAHREPDLSSLLKGGSRSDSEVPQSSDSGSFCCIALYNNL